MSANVDRCVSANVDRCVCVSAQIGAFVCLFLHVCACVVDVLSLLRWAYRPEHRTQNRHHLWEASGYGDLCVI